jgi:hypothetical protein
MLSELFMDCLWTVYGLFTDCLRTVSEPFLKHAEYTRERENLRLNWSERAYILAYSNGSRKGPAAGQLRRKKKEGNPDLTGQQTEIPAHARQKKELRFFSAAPFVCLYFISPRC